MVHHKFIQAPIFWLDVHILTHPLFVHKYVIIFPLRNQSVSLSQHYQICGEQQTLQPFWRRISEHVGLPVRSHGAGTRTDDALLIAVHCKIGDDRA